MGVSVNAVSGDSVLIRSTGSLRRASIKTQPYPGFPTDMQPQLAAILTTAEGTSVITEGVWDNRYKYVDELAKMGAKIQVDGRVAVIEGVPYLTGAPIKACDLRAGAALVIAGVCARGITEVTGVRYIERGYENIVGKLRALGADILSVATSEDEPESDAEAI